MFKNIHEPNASQTHGLHQADHIYLHCVMSCCNCKKTTSVVSDSCRNSCRNCDHPFCERCRNFDFPSGRQALYPVNEARRAFRPGYYTPTPSPPPLGVTSESNQPQNLADHEEQDPPENAQNEVNKDQEHATQPHEETLEEQHPSPIPRAKKRKLNMEKCQRCRDDKKGCNWKNPEKCDRCAENGFACSERTRVTRPRKLASKHVSPVRKETPPSTESNLLKEKFAKWTFLKSYHKMMTMATDRLANLEKDSMVTFDWNDVSFLPKARPLRGLESFVGWLLHALNQVLGEIITTENCLEAFTESSLTEGQRIALFVGPPDILCSECCTKHLKPTINKAIVNSLDDCGAFLAQQHLFREHYHLFDSDESNEAEDLRSRELERYAMFSRDVPQQARTILGSLNPDCSDIYGEFFKLYHMDIDSFDNIEWLSKSIDCLGRTPLHRFLDSYYGHTRIPDLEYFQDEEFFEMSWWNSQDVLGRTPLHVLCQLRFLDRNYEFVKTVLRAGANPGVETVFGSLPLHYAAAMGHLKICELLMEHKTKFDIGAQDSIGTSAIGYAMIKKHKNVENLLIDHYKEAGLHQEIERAIERKKHVEKFGPYP